MYEMKPEYYTGIAQIDEEHKKLFEIADEAYELYKRIYTWINMTTSLRF